jgi:hypothetical protein
MTILAEIIGWLIIIEGVLFLGEPRLFEVVARFFTKGKRLYLAAVLRLAMAVIVFAVAGKANLPWLAILCAAILLLSSLAGFAIKLQTQKQMLAESIDNPPNAIRFTSVMVIVFGMALAYAA